ncbi:hypothetical protein GOODEAATRI_030913, partial [Goodea atripinnis]
LAGFYNLSTGKVDKRPRRYTQKPFIVFFNGNCADFRDAGILYFPAGFHSVFWVVPGSRLQQWVDLAMSATYRSFQTRVACGGYCKVQVVQIQSRDYLLPPLAFLECEPTSGFCSTGC